MSSPTRDHAANATIRIEKAVVLVADAGSGTKCGEGFRPARLWSYWVNSHSVATGQHTFGFGQICLQYLITEGGTSALPALNAKLPPDRLEDLFVQAQGEMLIEETERHDVDQLGIPLENGVELRCLACPIVDTWWQTETGGILITPLPGAIDQKPGSATRPFFGVQPALVDNEGQTVRRSAAMLVRPRALSSSR